MAYIKGRKAFHAETFDNMPVCEYEDDFSRNEFHAGYEEAFHENMKANEHWAEQQ
jgi:hypothetical protein